MKISNLIERRVNNRYDLLQNSKNYCNAEKISQIFTKDATICFLDTILEFR